MALNILCATDNFHKNNTKFYLGFSINRQQKASHSGLIYPSYICIQRSTVTIPVTTLYVGTARTSWVNVWAFFSRGASYHHIQGPHQILPLLFKPSKYYHGLSLHENSDIALNKAVFTYFLNY